MLPPQPLTMLEIFIITIIVNTITQMFYFLLEKLIGVPILNITRMLGFDSLIREELRIDGTFRTVFSFNTTSFIILCLHSCAVIVLPWYATGFFFATIFTSFKTTFITYYIAQTRSAITRFHLNLERWKFYYCLYNVGCNVIAAINSINPFTKIRITRVSAETYGIISIFGIAAAVYYIARKFYVKKKNPLIPQAGNANTYNQASINLGLMVLSFVAFNDFSLWKKFSEWMRLQSYASSVFGIQSNQSCKNFSEKNKRRDCSGVEIGPNPCHGCCARMAQTMATANCDTISFDIATIMENPPDFYPKLVKQIIIKPTEIPGWFVSLPSNVQEAIFEGYYSTRRGMSVRPDRSPQITVSEVLAKEFTTYYNSSTNSWSLRPTRLRSDSGASSASFESVSSAGTSAGPDYETKHSPFSDLTAQIAEDPHAPAFEIPAEELRMADHIDLLEEIPWLSRVPSVLVKRVGFLVAMSLLTYGIYLYNNPTPKERPGQHKAFEPKSHDNEPEHRGKLRDKHVSNKQTASRTNARNTTGQDEFYEDAPTTQIWHRRFKSMLSKNYMLYDSNDLSKVFENSSVVFFGPQGETEVATSASEFRHWVARGYYCDPNVIKPISKGRVDFEQPEEGAEVVTDMSILQRMASHQPISTSDYQKVSSYLEDGDIVLDNRARQIVSSYRRSGDRFVYRDSRAESTILKRPAGIDTKLSEMTGKTLQRNCCTNARLCQNCTDILSSRKAARVATLPPVLQGLTSESTPNSVADSITTELKQQVLQESSAATATTDQTCPYDGRSPGCRQIGCMLQHPSLKNIPEALNGVVNIPHFNPKLSSEYVAMINLTNPNSGTVTKYGSCYVVNSHLTSAEHVFYTSDKKKIPIEHLSVQFPGSNTQFAIDGASIETIPHSHLDPTFAGEQVRFKLVENINLKGRKAASIGVAKVGDPILIQCTRGDGSHYTAESTIDRIEGGMLIFRSNTTGGDSGSPVLNPVTNNVVGTYWGTTKKGTENLALSITQEQLPFLASAQKIKSDFSHPSLRVTSQWRETY